MATCVVGRLGVSWMVFAVVGYTLSSVVRMTNADHRCEEYTITETLEVRHSSGSLLELHIRQNVKVCIHNTYIMKNPNFF